MIATREDWNRSYYGDDARAINILVTGSASNPRADALRQTVAGSTPAPNRAEAGPAARPSGHTPSRGMVSCQLRA